METDARPMVGLVTAPPDEAEGIALAIVERKLAACVNVVPGLKSFYWWEDEIERETEALLVVKSTMELVPALTELLRDVHPYDNFELVALPIEAGSEPYLEWMASSVRGR